MRFVRRFIAIRPAEQKNAWVAFLTLFGVVASLTILETARDALFLSKVPAARLPWMYIALALISLAVAKLQARFAGAVGPRSLAGWTFCSALVTLGLAWSFQSLGPAGVYVIYVWTSLSTMIVIVRLWTFLAARFTVTQARRLYGFIGAGSVSGAIAGSATARAFAPWMTPRQLVIVAGLGFAITSLLPLFFRNDNVPTLEQPHEPVGALRGSVGYIARQPYVLRLVLAMSVSTACVTLADYLFKSAAAAAVPPGELAAWLATVYLFLNIGSLFAQVVVTGWLTRRVSVPSAFSVLPLLLLAGGVGMVATMGIASALVIKAADGSFRYSLHKTTSEMLFFPFSDTVRQRVKAFIEVIGQRGGQAFASIMILTIAALGYSTRVAAMGLCALAVVWLLVAASLREGYLGLFRGRLAESHLRHAGFPELDLASLETLIATLNSDNDDAVLAALDALEREGKARLVPVLILYHPAPAVVERALAIFSRAGRTNAVAAIDRIIDHASTRVRAAALAARSVLDADTRPLLLRASVDESPEVRATVTVNLIASGAIHGVEASERTDAIVRQGETHAKIAFAEAIARRAALGFADTLVELSGDGDPSVRAAAARAMSLLRLPAFIAPAFHLLCDERTRRDASDVLVGLGARALSALTAAMGEPNQPRARRWRMAQIVPLFEPRAAASALSALLPVEQDGAVRFQLIRGLETIVRRNPEVPTDRALLMDAIAVTVRRAYLYLARLSALVRGAEEVAGRATVGHALLARVLKDKSHNAVERLFRLLGLVHPAEDFSRIYRAIIDDRPDARASGMELVANVLVTPLREAVIGLVDDASDAERLASAGPYRGHAASDYAALLDELLDSTSEAVRSVTVFHIGELALSQFAPRIERIARQETGGEAGASDAWRTLERLRQVPA